MTIPFLTLVMINIHAQDVTQLFKENKFRDVMIILKAGSKHTAKNDYLLNNVYFGHRQKIKTSAISPLKNAFSPKFDFVANMDLLDDIDT